MECLRKGAWVTSLSPLVWQSEGALENRPWLSRGLPAA